MEFTGVGISEVIFKERISSRKFCEIFIVDVRGETCVMKVHHGRGPRLPYENELREQNMYLCESRAYRRLTKSGACCRGIVPRFYGVIENIDAKLCQPHLHEFIKDEYSPTAILLEYIPNMKALHWTNYTEKRMQNFINGMKEIHGAQIQHSDVHPRNMMIVEGDPERAIWIDFDRAQTFSGELTELQKGWLTWEKLLVEEMAEFMKDDFAEGKMNKTFQYYR